MLIMLAAPLQATKRLPLPGNIETRQWNGHRAVASTHFRRFMNHTPLAHHQSPLQCRKSVGILTRAASDGDDGEL